MKHYNKNKTKHYKNNEKHYNDNNNDDDNVIYKENRDRDTSLWYILLQFFFLNQHTRF